MLDITGDYRGSNEINNPVEENILPVTLSSSCGIDRMML